MNAELGSAQENGIAERVGEWFRVHVDPVRIRLRRGEVCDALRAFGVSRKPDEDLTKFVAAGLMSVMPKVNGEHRASYHRDAVMRFIVENCRE